MKYTIVRIVITRETFEIEADSKELALNRFKGTLQILPNKVESISIVCNKEAENEEFIKKLLLSGRLSLTDVIDQVIKVNNLIGVGLISLSDNIRHYLMIKIKQVDGHE